MDLRRLYVRLVRMLRTVLAGLGLLRLLERSGRGWVVHLRSLFAIYDAEDLAQLGLPWWTYRAIGEVDRFLAARPGARAFEYGSGASTVWLSRRASEVVSVEHDIEHAGRMRQLLHDADDVRLVVVPARVADDPAVPSGRREDEGLDFARYVETIDAAGGPFDLIVIDGRARVACFERAIPHLADDGMIVFDDIRRRRYRPVLEHPGIRAQVTVGATPSMPVPTSTGLLRRGPT